MSASRSLAAHAAVALQFTALLLLGGLACGKSAAPPAPPLQPPVVSAFTATPATIDAGGTSELAWAVTGATSLTLDQGIGVVTGAGRAVSPAVTTTYTLTATNADGSATASTTVTVRPAPGAPVINSFTATPAGVAAGASSTLAWSATGATALSLDQGIGAVTGTSRSVTPAATTTYTLTASNAAGSVTASATVTVTPPGPSLTTCLPSGLGNDYQVGPGKPYTTLAQVPWEALGPGDTVRIFHQATPFKGKFLLAAKGTAARPVRICGVRGPGGERPEIDGNGAVTRAQLAGEYSTTPSVALIHEERSIIVFKPLARSDANAWTSYPSHIQVDGLAIRRAHPSYTFTDTGGASHPYTDFGACIWIDRGHDITIADNELSDCQMGIFSKSTDDGDFAVTRNIRIAGNSLWGHGIVGDVHQHSTYLQSVGLLVEGNRYGPLRAGAAGNSAKDRSAGSVYRYNLVEDGAHAFDLVEAEDFPVTALAEPAYRATFVYGNVIDRDGSQGSCIHYGGDHFGSTPGASWGEPIFRQGTLYFFGNTVRLTGAQAWLFQISTTLETVEAWDNVFVFAGVGDAMLRMNQWDIAPGWTAAGTLHLGRNWISDGWHDSDLYNPVGGVVTGTANLIGGPASPLDATTFVPLAGSAVVDAAVAGPAGASAHPLDRQLVLGQGWLQAEPRVVHGGAADLGAIER